MRYVIRWNNGSWKVRDLHRYTDVDVNPDAKVPQFLTRADAKAISERLNRREQEAAMQR